MDKMANSSPPSGYKPIVFLDRDGTLNVEKGYISKLDQLVLIDGAAQSVARLNQAGAAAVLVTNQTGAARGYYPESHIRNLNNHLQDLLAQGGAKLDAIYYCPHFAASENPKYAIECVCRKPATGMIDTALKEHPNFDRNRAYIVGDKYTDIELAANCGMKGVLVKSGYGESEVSQSHKWRSAPAFIAHTIGEAVDWILNDLGYN